MDTNMTRAESVERGGPPAAGNVLVEWISGHRSAVGYTLLVLVAVSLAATAYLGYHAFRTIKVSEETKTGESSEASRRVMELANPARGEYLTGFATTLTAALIAAAGGVSLLLRPSPPGKAEQLREARLLVLGMGGGLGLLLMLASLLFFYLWSESLQAWLDRGDWKQARWVLGPLLGTLIGAFALFFAIQPARADERHDPLLRRFIYSANFLLTVLLVLVALIVVNVIIAREMPAQLDTTATGFYSLSEPTRQLLERLEEPIHVYAIMANTTDRELNDIRQLLIAFRDVSRGRVQVRFLSQAADKAELASLLDKYPQFELTLAQRTTAAAVLLTAGEGEKRHAVLSDNDFFEGRSFVGESRLYREIVSLAGSDRKPVVYFTQGHGELDVSNNPDVPPDRSANRLRQYLERNYLEVRPLPLNVPNPAVPDDAAVVVVADPLNPFSQRAVDSLRAYMNRPEKKGKLLLVADATPGPDGRVLTTGIEPLLAEYNIGVGNRYIYTWLPDQVLLGAPAGFSREAARNPLFQSIIRVRPRLDLSRAREMTPLTTHPQYQAKELLLTVGTTWVEQERPADLGQRWEQILTSEAVMREVQISPDPRPVAVIVTEGTTPRAAAIGSGSIFTDELAQRARGSPLSFDLLGVTIDWLRGRDTSVAAVNIEAKKYTEYKLPNPRSLNVTRLLWLPLGLGLLSVVGLGAGVWVVRRQ